MKGFLQFIREQGVVGLAVGFILGAAVSKLVSSIVQDIVNPLLGLALGSASNISDAALELGGASIRWGALVTTFIDFVIIALVVYFGVKLLKLGQLDKKKE